MTGLDGLYQQVILDHSKRRTGDSVLEPFDAEHFERNPSCGDEITLRLRLSPDGGRIEAIGWQGDGCSISMASASVLAELAPGRTVEDARKMVAAFRELLRSRGAVVPDDDDLLGDAIAFEGVGKFVMRVKCAMLSWVALEAALLKAE